MEKTNLKISTFNHIIEKCPRCGRHNVHARLIKRQKRSTPKFRTIKKSIGYNDYEEKIPVKRKLNPTKAYNLFVTSPESVIKNPILGLPELEREDIGASIRFGIEIFRKDIRFYNLPAEILSLIHGKYPYPLVNEKMQSIHHLIIKGYEVLDEIRRSAVNEQWDRSLIDWIDISNTALEEGYHAASSKYYTITADLKKKHLSPKFLKKKTPKIQEFVLQYKKYVPYYILFAETMLRIEKSDPEIHKEVLKIESKYMREYVPKLLQMHKRALIEVQGDTKGTFRDHKLNKEGNDDDYYEYVEFRYFDKKIYEEQKLNIKDGTRKANPDGWKTCCTIRAEDLSVDIMECLRKRTDNRRRGRCSSNQ